jgi:hypothetical protein
MAPNLMNTPKDAFWNGELDGAKQPDAPDHRAAPPAARRAAPGRINVHATAQKSECLDRVAIAITKPYKFIGFGAIAITKPCKFIGFGAIAITKPYKFIGFGAIAV